MDYKRLSIILSIALVFTIGLSAFLAFEAYADKPITVIVDGKKINFPDAQPQFVDGRIMIPIRFVSEALGARVDRDAKTNTVYITSAPPAQCEPVQSPEQPEKPQQKQAAVGELVEFTNAKIKVTSVKYGDEYGDFVPFDGEKFALIHLDVYMTEEPKYSEYWSGNSFVDAIIIDGDKELRGSIFTTGESTKVKLNQWQSVTVAKSISKDKNVKAVIVIDPTTGETAKVTIN